MTRHGGAHPGQRAPALLALLGLLTVVVAAGLTLFAAHVIRTEHDRTVAENHVLSDVRYYDDVLTTSALLAAETGESRWPAQYDTASDALDASLAEAKGVVGDDVMADLARIVDVNDRLVLIEREALQLTADGDRERARALMAGVEYAALKSEYATALREAQERSEAGLTASATRWQLISALFIGLVLGGAVLVVVLARSTSRRVARAERSLREAMDAAVIGQALSGPDGAFLYVNPALCRMVDVEPQDLIGLRCSDIVPDLDEAIQRAHDSADHGTPVEHEHHVGVEGSGLWVRHVISASRGVDGERRFVHQFVDETEQHRLQQELAFRAGHDALTGLANRAQLIATLERRLSLPAFDHVGVLFVDVDRLKPVNDDHGHAAGDALLCSVAGRLLHSVRGNDLVARVGGDEFVVLLDGVTGTEEALAVARHVEQCVRGPVSVAGRTLEVSISVGCAVAAQGESVDSVLSRADERMYAAKRGRVDDSAQPST